MERRFLFRAVAYRQLGHLFEPAKMLVEAPLTLAIGPRTLSSPSNRAYQTRRSKTSVSRRYRRPALRTFSSTKPLLSSCRKCPEWREILHVIAGTNAGAPLIKLQKPWRRIRATANLHDVRIHEPSPQLRKHSRRRWNEPAIDRAAIRSQSAGDNGAIRTSCGRPSARRIQSCWK